MKTRILVLGGGFAGLAAVDELARWQKSGMELDIHLVDRSPHSVFAPLLPDLLSRRVRSRNVRYDLVAHCRRRGARFSRADVKCVEPAEKKMITSKGEYDADRIVVCPGCDTNYFGNSDAGRFAPGLKTVEEAETLRERTLRSPETVRVIVVGGGYTGFETASHLAYLLHHTSGTPYRQLWRDSRVMILEIAEDVLSNMPVSARRYATRVMRDFGVRIRTGVTVESFRDRHTARLTDGSTVENAVVAWTAGVKPGDACGGLPTDPELDGRIAVDDYLQVRGTDGVFAAGDAAGARQPDGPGPLRLSVPFAYEGGRLAARNAVASVRGEPMTPFQPFDPGYILPLAPGKGFGIVMGQRLQGMTVCALHYAISIAKSRGLHNRCGLVRDIVGGMLTRP